MFSSASKLRSRILPRSSSTVSPLSSSIGVGMASGALLPLSLLHTASSSAHRSRGRCDCCDSCACEGRGRRKACVSLSSLSWTSFLSASSQSFFATHARDTALAYMAKPSKDLRDGSANPSGRYRSFNDPHHPHHQQGSGRPRRNHDPADPSSSSPPSSSPPPPADILPLCAKLSQQIAAFDDALVEGLQQSSQSTASSSPSSLSSLMPDLASSPVVQEIQSAASIPQITRVLTNIITASQSSHNRPAHPSLLLYIIGGLYLSPVIQSHHHHHHYHHHHHQRLSPSKTPMRATGSNGSNNASNIQSIFVILDGLLIDLSRTLSSHPSLDDIYLHLALPLVRLAQFLSSITAASDYILKTPLFNSLDDTNISRLFSTSLSLLHDPILASNPFSFRIKYRGVGPSNAFVDFVAWRTSTLPNNSITAQRPTLPYPPVVSAALIAEDHQNGFTESVFRDKLPNIANTRATNYDLAKAARPAKTPRATATPIDPTSDGTPPLDSVYGKKHFAGFRAYKDPVNGLWAILLKEVGIPSAAEQADIVQASLKRGEQKSGSYIFMEFPEPSHKSIRANAHLNSLHPLSQYSLEMAPPAHLVGKLGVTFSRLLWQSGLANDAFYVRGFEIVSKWVPELVGYYIWVLKNSGIYASIWEPTFIFISERLMQAGRLSMALNWMETAQEQKIALNAHLFTKFMAYCSAAGDYRSAKNALLVAQSGGMPMSQEFLEKFASLLHLEDFFSDANYSQWTLFTGGNSFLRNPAVAELCLTLAARHSSFYPWRKLDFEFLARVHSLDFVLQALLSGFFSKANLKSVLRVLDAYSEHVSEDIPPHMQALLFRITAAANDSASFEKHLAGLTNLREVMKTAREGNAPFPWLASRSADTIALARAIIRDDAAALSEFCQAAKSFPWESSNPAQFTAFFAQSERRASESKLPIDSPYLLPGCAITHGNIQKIKYEVGLLASLGLRSLLERFGDVSTATELLAAVSQWPDYAKHPVFDTYIHFFLATVPPQTAMAADVFESVSQAINQHAPSLAGLKVLFKAALLRSSLAPDQFLSVLSELKSAKATRSAVQYAVQLFLLHNPVLNKTGSAMSELLVTDPALYETEWTGLDVALHETVAGVPMSLESDSAAWPTAVIDGVGIPEPRLLGLLHSHKHKSRRVPAAGSGDEHLSSLPFIWTAREDFRRARENSRRTITVTPVPLSAIVRDSNPSSPSSLSPSSSSSASSGTHIPPLSLSLKWSDRLRAKSRAPWWTGDSSGAELRASIPLSSRHDLDFSRSWLAGQMSPASLFFRSMEDVERDRSRKQLGVGPAFEEAFVPMSVSTFIRALGAFVATPAVVESSVEAFLNIGEPLHALYLLAAVYCGPAPKRDGAGVAPAPAQLFAQQFYQSLLSPNMQPVLDALNEACVVQATPSTFRLPQLSAPLVDRLLRALPPTNFSAPLVAAGQGPDALLLFIDAVLRGQPVVSQRTELVNTLGLLRRLGHFGSTDTEAAPSLWADPKQFDPATIPERVRDAMVVFDTAQLIPAHVQDVYGWAIWRKLQVYKMRVHATQANVEYWDSMSNLHSYRLDWPHMRSAVTGYDLLPEPVQRYYEQRFPDKQLKRNAQSLVYHLRLTVLEEERLTSDLVVDDWYQRYFRNITGDRFSLLSAAVKTFARRSSASDKAGGATAAKEQKQEQEQEASGDTAARRRFAERVLDD